MAASTRTRSTGGRAGLYSNHGFQRSTSPYGKFCYSSASLSSSSAFASSSSSFSSQPTNFFARSASPTRVNLCGSVPSVRFSIENRPISPSRSISSSPRDQLVKKQQYPLSVPSSQKRTCLCSPTSHPGSFRCSLHKNYNNHAVSSPSNRLNARRSAMTNSLVRIGTVEGEWVKRALAALIRPSSHQQKRRAAFYPRPSRLSVMSKAVDDEIH